LSPKKAGRKVDRAGKKMIKSRAATIIATKGNGVHQHTGNEQHDVDQQQYDCGTGREGKQAGRGLVHHPEGGTGPGKKAGRLLPMFGDLLENSGKPFYFFSPPAVPLFQPNGIE